MKTDPEIEARNHRVPTEDLANILEQHGPHARVALCRRIPPRFLEAFDPYREADTVEGLALAVGRLREQQARIEELEAWQDELLDLIETHRPYPVEAEYPSAWKLLCHHARRKFDTVADHVFRTVRERDLNRERQR